MGSRSDPLPAVIWNVEGEARFKQRAQQLACHWRSRTPCRLLVGLKGPLGAGKTTWVRGMLEGLGFRGRVPSPTYTLLEHYEFRDLTLVHIDLYRLPADQVSARQAFELEAIGVNDWLAQPDAWLLVEWPDRSSRLSARCDLIIEIEIAGDSRRRIAMKAHSPIGTEVLGDLLPDSA